MWLKDLIESINNAKNPIDRFLLRSILVVIFIGLIFIVFFGGYSLFIGKHLKVASKDYGIDNPISATITPIKSIKSSEPDSTNKNIPTKPPLTKLNHKKQRLKSLTNLIKPPIDTSKKNITPTIQAKNYAGVNLGGHVGDDYYGTTLGFTPDFGDGFIKFIEDLRRDSGITSKSLVLNPFINCNSQKFGTDLMNYLKSKNYRVSIRYNRMTEEIFDNIRVVFDKKENCFEINMGNLFVDKK